MTTIRELRRALFDFREQDRAAELGGAIALMTGDPTLANRLASLLAALDADHRVPAEHTREAASLSRALGLLDATGEAMVYTHQGREYAQTGKMGTAAATGEPSEEYQCVDDPAWRIRITASGVVLED